MSRCPMSLVCQHAAYVGKTHAHSRTVRRVLPLRGQDTHGRKTVGLVRRREELGFNNAGPVGQRKELHRLARDLMMRALFDNEAACRNGFISHDGQGSLLANGAKLWLNPFERRARPIAAPASE